MAHRSRTPSVTPPQDKICTVCGRTISWRKKWARDWDEVRYCSDACRRSASGSASERDELTAVLRAQLGACTGGATICPSEVARAVHRSRGTDDEDWRELMEPVRRAARLLVASGECVLTQGGRVVDPSRARGPVRIRPVRTGG